MKKLLIIILLLLKSNFLLAIYNIHQISNLDFGNILYTNQTLISIKTNQYAGLPIKESAKVVIYGAPNGKVMINFSPYVYKGNDGEFEIINNRVRKNGKIFDLDKKGKLEVEVIGDLYIKNNANLNGHYFSKIYMSVTFLKSNTTFSENITTHFNIQTPSRDKKLSDLNFGTIIAANNRSCKVTLNPNSNQRESDCPYVSDMYSLAKFTISAKNLQATNIKISGYNLINLKGLKSGALLLDDIEYKLQKINNLEYSLVIGGTLLIQPKVSTGNYSATYTLTINY